MLRAKRLSFARSYSMLWEVKRLNLSEHDSNPPA